MTTEKTTCRPLYYKLQELAAGYLTLEAAFAFGFAAGQAEKIYLGACKAAMFRPKSGGQDLLRTILRDIAPVYGLAYTNIGDEFWLFKMSTSTERAILSLLNIERDSSEWHMTRAILCGIPFDEIDFEFHKRRSEGTL